MIGKHLGRLLRLHGCNTDKKQLLQTIDMGYNKRYKRLSELTIAELACNKNLDEILDLQDLLKQSIRSHLSRLLLTP